MMDYIDGTVSGVSNTPLDTSWTAWVMVIIYSRFVLLFILNVFLVVIVIVDCNVKKEPKTEVDVSIVEIIWNLKACEKA